MKYIAPKNWAEFQHYKDRSPTWIKLHKSILDNYDYQRLPLASKALAPMLWLLASEYEKGKIPLDYDLIAFRLRVGIDDLEKALNPLFNNGFFVMYQDASKPLAECLPREEDIKHINLEEKEKPFVAPKARPSKKPPDDFSITPEMREWARTKAPNVNVDLETEAFMDHTFAAAKTDWIGTWRNWMRRSSRDIPRTHDKRPTLGLADQVMQNHQKQHRRLL